MELAEQLMRPPSADAMGFVNELGRPVLHSNSIKLTNVDFSGPRWLITLPDVDHPTSLSDAVIGAVSKYCKTDASAFIRRFDSRTALHVGYAEEKGQAIRKLYVEYTDAEGNPAYEAVKVSSSVSEFHHYRSTKVDETLMHLDLPEETLSHVQTLIASVRSEISVLEVKSRSSSRISMDVNISDLDLQDRRAIAPILGVLVTAISPATRMSKAASQLVNHFSIGTDASKCPFLTLYAYPQWVEPN